VKDLLHFGPFMQRVKTHQKVMRISKYEDKQNNDKNSDEHRMSKEFLHTLGLFKNKIRETRLFAGAT